MVSVIIPHHADLRALDICLTALAAQTWPRDRTQIIVADNDSPEGEAAVGETMAGRASLITVRERGAGPARNGGAALATGDILAFTDCDCRPEPGWLAAGVAALSDHDFAGGRMVVLVEDPARMTPAEAFERVFAFDNESYVKRKQFTVSANLFCPRTVFETVGGFGVGLSEDLDWCRRAASAGYRIGYAPAAAVGHPARRTWAELERKWRRLDAESFALFAAKPGGRALWLIRALALPFSAIAHTPKALTSPALATLGQRMAALSMLYRLRWWRLWDSLALGARGGRAP
jgi:GT2 family glycosyltransferase